MSGAETAAAPARLIWRGVTDGAAGQQRVQLDAASCRGCKGACSLASFARPRIFLNADLGVANGRPVEVVAGARRFTLRALGVFGTPLAVALAAASLGETMAWPDWLIAVAPLGAIAAMAAIRCAWPRAGRPLAVECDSEVVRIRID